MIGVDTNILIRLTIADDAAQAAKARALVEGAAGGRDAVYINPIVLAEYVWTLKRVYRSDRATLADAVEQFFDRPPFQLFDEAVVSRALGLFRDSSADFGDCLIGALNEAARAAPTFSFDMAATALPVFAKP